MNERELAAYLEGFKDGYEKGRKGPTRTHTFPSGEMIHVGSPQVPISLTAADIELITSRKPKQPTNRKG